MCVCCTRKLLDWPGDWYANPIAVGRADLILCVPEVTLLPVVVPARELRWFPSPRGIAVSCRRAR